MNAKRTNLLWLFPDQLRHHALGCYGDPIARTPVMDRLAAEGVACDLAVTQCPVCMPFRGGLMTGQYGHVNGLRVHGDLLTPEYPTVAHAYRDAGYRTSYVGKLHLASTNSNWVTGEEFWVHPRLRAGFQDFFGFDLSNHYYNTHYCTGYDCQRLKVEGHQTDGLTDLSLKYLSETAIPSGKPWFHVVAWEAPHPGGGNGQNRYPPFPSPPEYEELFDPQAMRIRENVPDPQEEKIRKRTAGYYAMVAHLDYNIGRILSLLEKTGQLDNTLIVLFADHGEMLGSHGRFNKEVAYDEALRIPLLMRLPGTLPAGTRYTNPVSGIDIYPTSAALCGVPASPEVQGLDLSASLCGRNGPTRSEVLVQWLGKTRYGWGDYPYRAIRTPQHTYCVSAKEVHEQNGGHFRLLYDNETDPYQLNNLFGKPEARELQQTLHAQLCRAIEDSKEPLPDFVKEAF